MGYHRSQPTPSQLRQAGLGFPPGAVAALHELFGLGQVGGFHVRAVPFHAATFPQPQRHAAKQDDFGEVARDFKVGIGGHAFFHHAEPFLHVTGRTRDDLRDVLAGFMVAAGQVFRGAVHGEEKLCAVVIG